MARPTLALALIAKNEAHNIRHLAKSIEGCFDEVHLTDTGSTDDTVKIATELGWKVHHFTWINDFAAARNASFEPVKTDYIMWMDLDDVLGNPGAFKLWRDNAMALSDYWLATYHYASDAKGTPVCSFARERVVKRSLGLSWNYFVHEGIKPISPFGMQIRPNYISTWNVVHRRGPQDMAADKSRNLNLFKDRQDKLDSRMWYYYGKELFENQQPVEACHAFNKAMTSMDLEIHDRIMCMEYACYAYMACNQWQKALEIAQQGLMLVPRRAEFHVLMGDALIKTNKVLEAAPSFAAAKVCRIDVRADLGYAGPIFNRTEAYTFYPRLQLARIYAQTGDLASARLEAEECFKLYQTNEALDIIKEIDKALNAAKPSAVAKQTDDIVITCPMSMYEWDPEIEKTRGVGGSEIAAIQMAHWLRRKSGQPVIVFNPRSNHKTIDGVEYVPHTKMAEYFQENKPAAHIAWRHNMKLTDAPTYFWCHDLMAVEGHVTQNYEKLLCLSPFHKDYVMAMQGIPEEKILVTRNGIIPERFAEKAEIKKIPGKFIFGSSPDRGLDRAMRILDRLVGKYPEITLHVFYGFDNMRKGPPEMVQLAAKLEGMIAERPWVKYHGNVDQKTLARHEMESQIWLHPANFIETFCITALEMLASGVYPVTRRLGALRDTLAQAERDKMATLLDIDCETETQYTEWADAVEKAYVDKAWERVSVNPSDFGWEHVATEWLPWLLQSQRQ